EIEATLANDDSASFMLDRTPRSRFIPTIFTRYGVLHGPRTSIRSITSPPSPRSRETSAKTKIGCATSTTKWRSTRASSGVYGVGEDGVQAFTDFGIENLIELIRFYKEPWTAPAVTLWPAPNGYSNFRPGRHSRGQLRDGRSRDCG